MKDFPTLDAATALSFLLPPCTLDDDSLSAFSSHIHDFYDSWGRSFAWRETTDPYRILLSEVMLQQTQTARVEPKYELFLSLWPGFEALAKAPLEELLFHWKGLGYNRRALNLRKSAQMTEMWGWTIPADEKTIRSLPGVGKATAAAVMAFCYQKQSIYLETNIRRVLLYSFYPDQDAVKDAELEVLLFRLAEKQADMKRWYYALMDYGVLLKYLVPNANQRSAHYSRQSRFENSNRQIRGQLIHLLCDTGEKSEEQICSLLSHFSEERILNSLEQLKKEGFVAEESKIYKIAAES